MLNNLTALIDAAYQAAGCPPVAKKKAVAIALGYAVADPAQVQTLAKRIADKQPALWTGEWQRVETDLGSAGYPSQSEADFAMCGYVAREAMRIGVADDALQDCVMSVFGRSGLYREDKHKRVAERDIPKIVAKVLADKADTTASVTGETGRILTLAGGRVAALESSPPREWVVKKFLPKQTVFTLGGVGGSAKTALAIAIGVHVAAGEAFHGMATNVGGEGVVFVLGEEDTREAHARINAGLAGKSAEEKKRILDNILAFGMLGESACMVTTIDRQAVPTAFVGEIIDVAKEHAGAIRKPVGLIVLDHARMMAAVDLNDGNAASILMRSLGKIAVETGACVLLIAHSPKSSIDRLNEASAQDIAGSAALVDMARGSALVRVMSAEEAKKLCIADDERKKYASLEMFKANYAAPFDKLWFEKVYDQNHDTIKAVPRDVQPPQPEVKARRANLELGERIVNVIQDHPGPLWVNKLLDRYAGKTKALKASVADVELALGDLRRDGRVTIRDITAQERAEYSIHHTAKMALKAES